MLHVRCANLLVQISGSDIRIRHLEIALSLRWVEPSPLLTVIHRPHSRNQSLLGYDPSVGFTSLRTPRNDRIVISGFGCLTPLGNSRDALWDGYRTSKSGIRRIEAFDTTDDSRTDRRRSARYRSAGVLPSEGSPACFSRSGLAVGATKQALADARLESRENWTWRRADGSASYWAPAVAGWSSRSGNTRTGSETRRRRPASTRSPPRPAERSAAKFRWRFSFTVRATSSRQAARVRRTRSSTPAMPSFPIARISSLPAASMRRWLLASFAGFA